MSLKKKIRREKKNCKRLVTRRLPVAANQGKGTDPKSWIPTFLKMYKQRYSFQSSCRVAGVSRSVVYRLKKSDPEFAKNFEETKEEIVDKLEDSAMRRAIHGYNSPIFFKGAKCGSKRVYSDILTIFMLKKNRKAYDDKVSGMLDPEEYAARLAEVLKSANRTVPGPDDPVDAAMKKESEASEPDGDD